MKHQDGGAPTSGNVSWNALGCRNAGTGGTTELPDVEHQDGEAPGMQENVDGKHKDEAHLQRLQMEYLEQGTGLGCGVRDPGRTMCCPNPSRRYPRLCSESSKYQIH